MTSPFGSSTKPNRARDTQVSAADPTELKPWAAGNLIHVDFNHQGNRGKFVIDPGTQRWSILTNEEAALLKLFDGKRPLTDIKEIAEANMTLLDTQHVGRLTLRLLKEGLVTLRERDHSSLTAEIVRKTPIEAIHLEITNACNLRCTHCYTTSGKPEKNELSHDELRDIIDTLEPHTGKKLAVSGGEPTVRKDLYPLLEYAAIERGLSVDLYTNAMLFTDKDIEVLQGLANRAPHPFSIQISLEGGTSESHDLVRGKGAFDKTVEIIEKLCSHGLSRHIILFVCLSKNNVHEIPKMYQFARSRKLGMFKLSQWQKQGRASDTSWEDQSPDLDTWLFWGQWVLDQDLSRSELPVAGPFFGELSNSTTGTGCYEINAPLFPKVHCNLNIAPRIDSKGNTWSCQMFVETDALAGNTRENSVKDIFEGPIYAELLETAKTRTKVISECQSCQWLPVCGGGCIGHSHAETGDFVSKDLFCETRKYWFQEYVDQQVKRYFSDEKASTASCVEGRQPFASSLLSSANEAGVPNAPAGALFSI